MKTMTVQIPNIVADWLEELAAQGALGSDAQSIAERFICAGVGKELRGPDGFLFSPPPRPRKPKE